MAVDLPVYIAVSLRPDSSLRFFFPQLKERKRANLSTLKFRREDRWANAVKAVISGFVEDGYACKGMNITVYSDILPSAGFGITTAIKAASAVALRALYGFSCNEKQLLQVIEKGNRDFLNNGHYLADLYAALYAREGTCLLTDHEAETYEYLPFPFSDVAVVLTDARVPRISVWDEETLRTPENLQMLEKLKVHKNGTVSYDYSDIEINEVMEGVNEDVRRRLLCIMNERLYVTEAAGALSSDSFSVFARSVNKSHEGMRDLYEVSCPEIDWLIKRVQEFDIASGRNLTSCARITGKGFGRCTYTILKKEFVGQYTKKLSDYERIFGFHPVRYIVCPAGGAAVL